MKFKDLTKEQIKKMYTIYWDKSRTWDNRIKEIMDMTGRSERTVRKWCSNLGFTDKSEQPSEHYEIAKKNLPKKGNKVYFVTWAQNNTKIHTKFFNKMLSYADFRGAEILVIAGRYHNPTTVSEAKNTENNEWWDEKILPYISAKRFDLHKYLTIMSDLRIQPTAINPMSGMEGMSKENSCVFGHPKSQMEMIPVLNGYKPKMMLTTGAVTKMNYSDSKSGKKAEFHHQFGFVIVEVENDEIFHIRQVLANDTDGSFYDLCYSVNDGGVEKMNNIEAIVVGDLHYGQHDDRVINRTIELMDKITPKNVILHDVFDGESISHHTQQDPFKQYGLEKNDKNNLKREIDNMINGIAIFKHIKNVIIVRSNHDVHLDKYLTNDWRRLPTPKNSIEYMEYAQILLKQHANEDVIGVIPELIKREYPNYKTLTYNDSYKICGNEIGMHGDIGSNGSRGGQVQFRKLNTKMVVAHSHSPFRKDNVICVGTTTKLRLSYNKGASGWLNTHVIIHKNGKTQHINFIGKNKNFTTIDL